MAYKVGDYVKVIGQPIGFDSWPIDTINVIGVVVKYEAPNPETEDRGAVDVFLRDGEQWFYALDRVEPASSYSSGGGSRCPTFPGGGF